MARKFTTVDYAQSGQQRLTIDDCLPADHLARFMAGIVKMLDLRFPCVLCGGGW